MASKSTSYGHSPSFRPHLPMARRSHDHYILRNTSDFLPVAGPLTEERDRRDAIGHRREPDGELTIFFSRARCHSICAPAASKMSVRCPMLVPEARGAALRPSRGVASSCINPAENTHERFLPGPSAVRRLSTTRRGRTSSHARGACWTCGVPAPE